MLSTIPPRANGGNMDDPNLTEGTTVYFPVFVKGALFSIGDTHAIQGLGKCIVTSMLGTSTTSATFKSPTNEHNIYASSAVIS